MKMLNIITVLFALYPYIKEVVNTTEEIDNIVKAGKSADIPNEVIISTIEEHLVNQKKMQLPQILKEWRNVEDVRLDGDTKSDIKKEVATILLDSEFILNKKIKNFKENNKALFTAIVSLLIEVRLYFINKNNKM